MKQRPKAYIGDGLYAQTTMTNDILLTVEDGSEIYACVAISNQVFQALVQYCLAARINGHHNGY